MTERITGVEGTRLDTEFQEMERRTDLFNELTEDLQLKTKEYLQPNPTVRAKMAAVKGISKLSGQAKASTYPQPEGTLGDAMCTYGRKLQVGLITLSYYYIFNLLGQKGPLLNLSVLAQIARQRTAY